MRGAIISHLGGTGIRSSRRPATSMTANRPGGIATSLFEQFNRARAWRQQRGDLDKLAGALAGPPSIRYFDLANA